MKGIFKNHGILIGGILNVSPGEAFELCSKGAIIIDVREEYLSNFKLFDVPQIAYFPKSTIEKDYVRLSKNKYLIFADTVGLRSKEAVLFLREKGFNKIANMAGGIIDWERDGFPVKTNIEERLSGSCMCQLKKRQKTKVEAKRRP